LDVPDSGYSHGGGVIYNMSQRLYQAVQASQPGSKMSLSDVVFVGTIDAVVRNPVDLHWPSPVTVSPGYFWPASNSLNQNLPFDINFWEPYGAGELPVFSDTHGAWMFDAANQEIDTLSDGAVATHTNIENDPAILQQIETDLEVTFAMLINWF
jgi:hypothetical protein